MNFNINDALVKAVELSTVHISKTDNDLLQRLAVQHACSGFPVVFCHEHGCVIVIGEPTVGAIKDAGASAELAFILDSALKAGDILFVAFEGDGQVMEELPQFDC